MKSTPQGYNDFDTRKFPVQNATYKNMIYSGLATLSHLNIDVLCKNHCFRFVQTLKQNFYKRYGFRKLAMV